MDDFDEKLAEVQAAGHDFKVWQRDGKAPRYPLHACMDIATLPGVMILLLSRSDAYGMYFGLMRQAADEWDGTTDPIRMLDMSTGVPKTVP